MTADNRSLAEIFASLPPHVQAAEVANLGVREIDALEYDWRFWGRPNQFAPDGTWSKWLVLAGRGFGKTRLGAEWIREQVEKHGRRRIALVAPTAADARDTIVEGDSGIMAISPPWNRPLYEPSKRRLTWPNGAIATTFSAEEPERLRGPNHDVAWCDELAAWEYVEATWDMLMFGLRKGHRPQVCITTTPKPLKLIRQLLTDKRTVVTRGSTFDNRSNLAPSYFEDLISKYEGTRLGRQELYAEVLDDVEGALWSRDMLDGPRRKPESLPDMARVVVAIDPAVTSGEDADETGMIVAGKGIDGRGYVLADLSCRISPDAWAKRAVGAYRDFKADRIIAETNNGGDLVERVIRTVDPNVSYRAVHASRGKRTRAEPVAALYEQGRISHVGGFPELEDQMCMYVPDQFDGSPDRVDALVWAMTELMLEGRQIRIGVL